MPVHLLKILLAELSLVRLVCTKCQTAVEIDLDKLSTAPAQNIICAGCGGYLRQTPSRDGDPNPLTSLAVSVRFLRAEKGCSVEFILPEKTTPAP
jgi:hypothetical protein